MVACECVYSWRLHSVVIIGSLVYCVRLISLFTVVLLLRPQERLRSIAMSMSVCLSVHEDISGTARAIFTNFFVDVAYGCGSVLLRLGDEIPREGAVLGVFFPIDNTLGPTQERLNQSRCRLGWSVGLARETVCYVGVTIPEEGAV